MFSHLSSIDDESKAYSDDSHFHYYFEYNHHLFSSTTLYKLASNILFKQTHSSSNTIPTNNSVRGNMFNRNQIALSDQLIKYDYSRKEGSKDSIMGWMSKISRSTIVFKDHVTLAPKVTETVNGKLSLGARIVKAGGIEKVFKRYFSISKNETLLKASQCYLSTTTGPIVGLLFISNEKIAFRSDGSITLSATDGDIIHVLGI